MHSYGSKQVPQVRVMLLKAIEAFSETQRRVTKQLFGQVAFTETCTACGGCVGVCPTGAIVPSDEDKFSPAFDQSIKPFASVVAPVRLSAAKMVSD
jgi:ferredoxin